MKSGWPIDVYNLRLFRILMELDIMLKLIGIFNAVDPWFLLIYAESI